MLVRTDVLVSNLLKRIGIITRIVVQIILNVSIVSTISFKLCSHPLVLILCIEKNLNYPETYALFY